jgi:proliferating cell nuclear antigen
MFLKTVQATSFRNIFEVLKDIINDINIYFDSTGIRISTLDTARVSLVHMVLGAENFEEYSCPTEIIAGLNIGNTYKLLKSITNNDTLSISINGPEFMDIVIHNYSKKSMSKFSLKLLDIDEEVLDIPDITMDMVTTLPSVDFQRICRDMGNLSNDIKIRRHENLITFSCCGDFANQETQVTCTESVSSEMSNIFSLRYINLFTKATGMSSSVQLLQSSGNIEMPIILRYTVANLGDIKFFLAPKTDV